MSIRKNTWNLDEHYDLTKSGQNAYSSSGGPYLFYSVGENDNGNFGINDTIERSSPIQLPGDQWIDATTSRTVTATKSDGTLWSWGEGSGGSLGLNDNIDRSSPVQVPGTQWTTVVQSGYTDSPRGALKNDGTLWMWGNGFQGATAQNEGNIPRSSPIQVPGTQWSYVEMASRSVISLKTDNTVWTWGQDGNCGWTGQNEGNIPRSSPVQVPGTQWSSISASYWQRFGIKTDGSLWTWGYGTSGGQGLNDVISRSSPHQIPGTWSAIGSGSYSDQLAVKTDGTLWAWGDNGSGQLGTNDTKFYSSPVQIPGTYWTGTPVKGVYVSYCKKTDGTMWVWGQNDDGQLGLNDIANRSSPIQLPGTGWVPKPTQKNGSTLLLKK